MFLVTPPSVEAASFAPRLGEALAAGDVAAVLIAERPAGELEALAAALVPVIQEAGAAALVADDTRLAGHVKADGVQIGTGLEDLRLAVESFRPKRIVGAGEHRRRATPPWRPARPASTISSSAARTATRTTRRIRRRSTSRNGGRS